MPVSDVELILRACQNEMGAFRELLDRYKKKIYYTALGIVGNHHDAEDVLQETFLQALRSLSKLRNPDGFSSWILRIAHNKAIDVIRRGRRETSGEKESDEGLSILERQETDNPQADPHKQMQSGEISVQVRKVVEKMPESQRTAFMLKHVSQLSIREIANTMEASEATVKTNIYRAVQKLREELQPLIQTQPGLNSAMNTSIVS